MSFIVGRSALALSLGTMALGALSILPLYAWVSDMTNRRTALTCCVIYTLVPSIVLFTATSVDIAFMPFTLTTLFLFWRAIHRRSLLYGFAAGAMYGCLSLLSFSLISLGAFFALTGLWRLTEKGMRTSVFQTAFTMSIAAIAVHLAVWQWSGFDVLACFELSKAQFDTDQQLLESLSPRFPPWLWKIANPACWFFFAGIPVSLLCLWRLAKPESSTKALFVVFALTFVALDLLYLARGEGERSAMYVLPFMVIPAGHLLSEIGQRLRSHTPLLATCVFLGFQTWLIETHLYTYW